MVSPSFRFRSQRAAITSKLSLHPAPVYPKTPKPDPVRLLTPNNSDLPKTPRPDAIQQRCREFTHDPIGPTHRIGPLGKKGRRCRGEQCDMTPSDLLLFWTRVLALDELERASGAFGGVWGAVKAA